MKLMKFIKTIIPLILLFLLTKNLYASAGSVSVKEIDWFWFFYEYTVESNSDTVVYRPFFMEANSGNKMFQASLMPLFYWRYKDGKSDVTKGFFGLYQSDNYSHNRKGDDYDSGFFPLYLYGNGGKEEDRYLVVYPFGGNIKGKFAHDRISPWVFPGVALFFLYPPSGFFTWQTLFWTIAALIPAYTEFEFKDYSGKAILWPLIKWGRGDKRYDKRVFPFYSHNYKEGWYDTYSWFLLFNYREIYFKDDTRYTFFFFPFYGRKWSDSGDIKAQTVLWPFFSWGYDKKTNDRSCNLPWPFVQIRDCDNPKIRSRIFFPFYGRYNYGSHSRSETFFVTPLYIRLTKERESYTSANHITCLLFWYFKRDYSVAHEYYGNSWRYFKIWPFMQIEWNDKDMYSINILSLLPFRDTMGYEKLYQPFWTLFEYRKKPDGEKHLGILLRTYYQVWSDNMFKMKIPLVLTYDRRGESIKEFSFLLSSFGYEKDSDGSYVKFFWIPFRIGEGDSSISFNESNDEISEEMDSPYYRTVKAAGFNSEHADLFDRTLDGNCFLRANIF